MPSSALPSAAYLCLTSPQGWDRHAAVPGESPDNPRGQAVLESLRTGAWPDFNPNETWDGTPVLHGLLAQWKGTGNASMKLLVQVVRGLLAQGADVTALDGQGRTPLEVCNSWARLEEVKSLLVLGTGLEGNADLRDSLWTALRDESPTQACQDVLEQHHANWMTEVEGVPAAAWVMLQALLPEHVAGWATKARGNRYSANSELLMHRLVDIKRFIGLWQDAKLPAFIRVLGKGVAEELHHRQQSSTSVKKDPKALRRLLTDWVGPQAPSLDATLDAIEQSTWPAPWKARAAANLIRIQICRLPAEQSETNWVVWRKAYLMVIKHDAGLAKTMATDDSWRDTRPRVRVWGAPSLEFWQQCPGTQPMYDGLLELLLRAHKACDPEHQEGARFRQNLVQWRGNYPHLVEPSEAWVEQLASSMGGAEAYAKVKRDTLSSLRLAGTLPRPAEVARPRM